MGSESVWEPAGNLRLRWTPLHTLATAYGFIHTL
jgi:hypothetical protein